MFSKEDIRTLQAFVEHYKKGVWNQTPLEVVEHGKLIAWLGSLQEKIQAALPPDIIKEKAK